MLETKNCNADNGVLFGINTKKIAKKHKDHEIKENYFYFKTDKLLDKEKFEDFVKNMPKNVYRAKGFIKSNEGDFLFNYVAGRHELEEFKADKTELVFIGQDVNKYKDKIILELEKAQMQY